MKELILQGDVVKATAGRDKDKIFLVVSVKGDRALIVNGKSRKVIKPKSKNIKHLVKINVKGSKELAERICKGLPTSNKNVIILVGAKLNNKEE